MDVEGAVICFGMGVRQFNIVHLLWHSIPLILTRVSPSAPRLCDDA